MRYSSIFLILTLLGCSPKHKEEKAINQEDLICELDKEEALKSLQQDTLQLVLINNFPRYEKELKELLGKSSIQLKLVSSMHGEGYCKKSIMDSVLNVKFGSNYIPQIMNNADSLFFESNREMIFSKHQLDEWPTLANKPELNDQEEIIKRLNKKNLPNDSVEFIPNIVDASYFVISFNVNKDRTSSKASIAERHSTENYRELESLILNEVNALTEWIPGKIRNESVSSTIDIAIAVNKKRNTNNR